MKLITSIIAAIGLATSASAFEFTGGNVNGLYGYNNYPHGDAYTQWQLNGSAEFSVQNGFLLQLDGSVMGYPGYSCENCYALGIHGRYQLSPGRTIGVFYNNDFWGPGEKFVGGEAVFDMGAVAGMPARV